MAIEEFKQFIADSAGTFSAVSTGVDGTLPLLASLTSTNAAEIAALVPQLIQNLPDDPRLVGPLWQCLSASGIENTKEQCSAIAQRLLTLVIDPNSFAELERQDPHDREFLTQIRSRAYPFKNALRHDHNLVTLLAWADYLGVVLPNPNRFLEAKDAGRLNRMETDQRRTVSISPFWPARILSGLEIMAAFALTIIVLIVDSKQLLHPFGWLTLAVIVGVAAAPLLPYIWLDRNSSYFTVDSSINPVTFDMETDYDSGNFIVGMPVASPVIAGLLLGVIIPLSFAICTIPLITLSVPGYIGLAVCCQALFWATDLKKFSRRRRYYLYKPNEYIDIYDDPRSRHWLVPGGGPGL
jgi:hypothetical protein